MSQLFATPSWAEVRGRLPRLVIGLILCGASFGLIVNAGLGLDPWDVLHEGVSDRTGIPIGTVSILVSFVVMLGWIPLRQRVGIGTILNAVLIGLTMDVVIPRLPVADTLPMQWAQLVLGLVVIGPGRSLRGSSTTTPKDQSTNLSVDQR